MKSSSGTQLILAFCLVTTLLATSPLVSQSTSITSTAVTVPPLVKFSGVVKDDAGHPKTGVVGVTFALYKDQQGGAPLWLETQNVQADGKGNYAVLLGSSKSEGLPTNFFASGEARWLGVQPQGQNEQPRVLLVSAPYALKAADAETLGGKPASAFAPSQGSSQNGGVNAGIGGTGKTDFIPIWKSSKNLGNSTMFESSGNVGIGTTSPATALDVNGTGGFRDTLTLFPNGSDPTLSVHGTAFAVSSSGLLSFVSGQTFPGTGTITGVTAGTDLTGGGSNGNVTLNLDTTKVPQLNAANTFNANQTINGTLFGQTGSFVANSKGAVFSVGNQNQSGYAISGVNENTNGDGAGVEGNGPNGVVGIGTTRGVAAQGGLIGVEGDNGGTVDGSVGVYGWTPGTSGKTYGVLGIDASPNGTGVLALGQGVSSIGSGLIGCCVVGLWGDTSSGAAGAAGLVGTADDARAIYLQNNSPSGVPTAYMYQGASGKLALVAGGAGGACTVDTNGHLSCAHELSVLASVDSGQRHVALYAVGSPQNWFEDFGSGQLTNGVAAVTLDRTFAQAVDTTSDYHVFLTPEGNCRGLYVSHKTATGFEVNELGDGQSNVSFAYRIVALRRGYENVRLEDMTEQVRKMNAPQPKATPGPRFTMPAPRPNQPATISRPTPNVVGLSAQR